MANTRWPARLIARRFFRATRVRSWIIFRISSQRSSVTFLSRKKSSQNSRSLGGNPADYRQERTRVARENRKKPIRRAGRTSVCHFGRRRKKRKARSTRQRPRETRFGRLRQDGFSRLCVASLITPTCVFEALLIAGSTSELSGGGRYEPFDCATRRDGAPFRCQRAGFAMGNLL